MLHWRIRLKDPRRAPSGYYRQPPLGGADIFLEARLPDARQLAPEGQCAEANAAHADESDVPTRAPASFAPVVELDRILHRPGGQFTLLALPLFYFCLLGQMEFPDKQKELRGVFNSFEGHAEKLEHPAALLVRVGGGHNIDLKAAQPVDEIVVDLWKHDLF